MKDKNQKSIKVNEQRSVNTLLNWVKALNYAPCLENDTISFPRQK